MTLIRKDPKEELTEHICDNICKYSNSDLTQSELDEKCERCIVNRIVDVVLEERID
ncbi:MAG: hypothetical protein HFJ98_00370 [Eubacterium sp.]|nr:hypothetical protein [Eubacterium sp.]